MKYACFELRLEFKDYLNQIKIPFSSRREAEDYIDKHFDISFHKKAWVE